jgi:hypothetical protein
MVCASEAVGREGRISLAGEIAICKKQHLDERHQS